MTIDSGTRFGSYEVVAQIGAGGMGEVYRATDVTLKREVAIKILPQAFADNADRVARFRREAETLAALNHPNVAQVYGLEHSAGHTAIVMELVDGPTLADRIEQGPLPWDEALGVALQLTAALEAAHSRGIVHRDLKPANIKVRSDGTVKVLDFGIATAPESPLATSSRKSPAQLAPALTVAGILLGTAAYMAPEQARGRVIDARADIWSFGCVLYEMLTGQPAFGGDDATTTLARVLEREPRLEELPRNVPASARQTLEHCLMKDPARRIADIRDVRLMLEGRFADTGRASAAASPEKHRWRRVATHVGAAAAGAAVVAAIVAAWLWPESVVPPVYRSVHSLGALSAGGVFVSDDGRRIVYNSTNPQQMWVRDLDAFEAEAVSARAGGLPCLSPDSTSIAFSAANGTEIARVPLTGGATVRLADGLSSAFFCDWPGDGYIYFDGISGIGRVAESGDEPPQFLTPRPEAGLYLKPQLLPDGRHVFVTIYGGVRQSAAVLDLETREVAPLADVSGLATFAATGPGELRGHILYGRDGDIVAVPVDIDARETGPAEIVVEGVSNAGPVATFNVGDFGTLAYVPGSSGASLHWVGRDDSLMELDLPPQLYRGVDVSPDGTRLAVAWGDFDTLESHLATYEVAKDRPLIQLTFEGNNVYPLWQRDDSIVYIDLTRLEIRALPADNSGPSILLAPATNAQMRSTSTSRDGKLLVGDQPAGRSTDLWMLRLDGTAPAEVEVLLATEDNERNPDISPDGRYYAYTSDVSGMNEVYVRPLDGTGGPFPVSTGGGSLPEWNPLGGELFYVNGRMLMAVPVETDRLFQWRTPEALVEFPATFAGWYAVDHDGSRFLVPVRGAESPGDGREIRIVVNWFDELRRLAPWPGR